MAWSSRRRQHILSLLILGTLLGVVFGLIFLNVFPEKCTDVDGFGELASRFANDFTLAGSTRRAPLYPMLLGSVFRLAGSDRPEALVAFHALCLGLLGSAAYLLSLKAFHSDSSALITGLMVILNPFVLWYVPRFWLEPVLTLLVVWLVYTALGAVEKPSPARLGLFGLACGIAALCKAVTLLFPLFMTLGLGTLGLLRPRFPHRLPRRSWLAFLTIPTAAALLVITPWILRNRAVTGRWIPVSSNLGIEYFRGLCLARQDSWRIGRKTLSEMLDRCVREEDELIRARGRDPSEVDYLEKNDLFRRLMLQDIRHAPQRLIAKTVKQVPAFWYRGDTWWSSLFFLGLSALFLILTGAAMAHFHARTPLVLITGMLIVYLNLLYAGLVAVARYSLPLYPLMTVLIVPWISEVWKGRRRKRQAVRAGDRPGPGGTHPPSC